MSSGKMIVMVPSGLKNLRIYEGIYLFIYIQNTWRKGKVKIPKTHLCNDLKVELFFLL